VNYDSACQEDWGYKAVSTIQTESLRPLRADARRNRERILEAARDVFAEYGLDAQIDDVARRAGVGVGTVYRHFPTKEVLLGELVRQKFRIFTANAQEALERDGEPFEIFADLLRRNAEVCVRDAAIQRVLTGFGDHVAMHAGAELEQLNQPVSELIARAQRAGSMRPDVTVHDIPMLMCGVSATMAQDGPGFDWRRHLEFVIDMLRA
jgi:AcrR family transcriptional regulator